MTRTSDQLLASVKRTVTMPANPSLLQDADILALAGEELLTKIVPDMISVRQDYFLRVERQAMQTNLNEYPIPYRAVGRTLQDLKIFDGTQTRRMSLIQTNDAHLFNYNAVPHSFYFKADTICVVPAPVSSDSLYLECWFFLRPSQPALTGDCGQITNVTGDTLTLANMPPSYVPGAYLDVIQGYQGNIILAYDCQIVAVSGMTVTLAPGSITVAVQPQPVPNVKAGDWTAIAETTPILQLPDECFQYLVYRTCARVLEAVGDFDGKRSLMEIMKPIETDYKMLIAPRIENEGMKVIQRNGLLRGARLRIRRGLVY